ncbi:azurin [Flaviramulus basaltis]|uniref:Azurin n=1 Tax=Flaviramulus basaltis TaxID=369401 RepID=A0A1K2IEU4_9FLAO|nr:azurin [Flaviramulus basaltis]SFZ90911.1 azurin [Flaviramulus basaltis]
MKIIKIQLLSILLASLMFNCGGKEEKKKEGFTYEKTSTTEKTESNKADDNVANIVITSNDLMQYNIKEIKAKAGQKVKLTLRHIGKLDINVMGHNVVILKQGVDLSGFAAKAATERDNKYIPKDSQDDIIAHTDLIGGGQVSSIEFDAPEAGTYDFLCSFPGHSGLMKGKFIVE